jgi:predicted AlkP superfamily phosphohydrolase/phosphomutase
VTPPSRLRSLILGLDGGTFDLLDPLVRAGELPFLGSMMAKGFRSPLMSVFPPKTIPAWYSFATGQDPGSLGIFGFTEPDGGPGKSKLVQTFRPAQAIWDHLSRNGNTVGVVNFPIRSGYPINGFVIPGMLGERPPTYPADLRDSVETSMGRAWVPELPPYRESDRTKWMDLAGRSVEQSGEAAEILIERFRPDFLFVLFRETDRVEHQLWSELSRPIREWAPDLLPFWRSVDAACQRIDRAFRAAGGPALTFVISDHGFGPARADFFTNRWLLENNYLKFLNGGDSFRRRLFARSVLAMDRLGIGRSMLSTMADRIRDRPNGDRLTQVLGGDSSFEGMAPKIDWKRTIAFSHPVPEGIYLNRRNPDLTPEQGQEALSDIRKKLESYEGARIEVYEPTEIYRGQSLDHAPSLLLKIDDLATEPRMDFSYPRPMLRHRPRFFYGTGVHRMDGILLVAGDGVSLKHSLRPHLLVDVAPTVLAEMELPIPPAMTGTPFHRELNGASA